MRMQNYLCVKNFVDQTVGNGFVRRHEIIAFRVALDHFKRLTGPFA